MDNCQTCEIAAISLLTLVSDLKKLDEARFLYRAHLWQDHHNPPGILMRRKAKKPSILSRIKNRIVTGRI